MTGKNTLDAYRTRHSAPLLSVEYKAKLGDHAAASNDIVKKLRNIECSPSPGQAGSLFGQMDEEFSEDMTRFEDARQSDRFVFISGQSLHPSEIAVHVREGLQAGKIVVVGDQPKYDIRLDAEQLESLLHIRARTATDATDAILRTYPRHAHAPFVQLSIEDMARMARDVTEPPVAVLDMHAPILQCNPILPGVHPLDPLRGANRLAQWVVLNTGPHVTQLHHDASAYGTSFQVHADSVKFWGFGILDTSAAKSLDGLCDIYTSVIEGDVSWELPEFTNPGTIHCVYTPKATVMTGGHFISIHVAHFVEFARLRERRAQRMRDEKAKAAKKVVEGGKARGSEGSHGAIGFLEDDVYAQDLLVQSMLCLHSHLQPIHLKPLISLCRMVAFPTKYLPAAPGQKAGQTIEAKRLRQYWNNWPYYKADRAALGHAERSAHARAKRILLHFEVMGYDTSDDHLLEGGRLENLGELYTAASLPLHD
ncbi:hypothetical protein FB107DRAFT_252338 [Schizophyllum commune]